MLIEKQIASSDGEFVHKTRRGMILKFINILPIIKAGEQISFNRLVCVVFTMVITVGISACGSKEKKPGQTLVRVNGDEITVLQVNDELKRAGVKADQQEAATKQLLEKLIDRQLILAEAIRNKIDRSPGVIQAIERAKVQIISQAYLENIVSKISKPSKSEIDEYFREHPEYFSQRKQFDIEQVIFSTKDFSEELKSVIDSAKSIDEVVVWLDKHGVRYARGQLSRTTTELPEPMVAKLKDMRKGELFIVNEGEKSMLNSITGIKSTPLSAADAAPQIEVYLSNKKAREVAEEEIKHLRSTAKIEYLGASAPSSP